MPPHNQYGKELLSALIGGEFTSTGPTVHVDSGSGPPGRIDGTIGSEVAVEIEARAAKQIRGAVMDLVLHPYPKKLLVILPVHAQNAETAAEQCRAILRRILQNHSFRVVLLEGDGYRHRLEVDMQRLRSAIDDLLIGGRSIS